MSLRKIAWGLWVAGTIVIVLSWMNLVTPKLGWTGWGVAFLGSILSYFGRRGCCEAPSATLPPSSVVSDLDRLVRLRDRGDITEEQYLRQRNALLGEPGGQKPPAP